MKMKNITIVISSFYPKIGGSERQLQLVASELAKRGYNIEVITRKYKGLTSVDYINNIRVKRIPVIKNNKFLEKISFYINSIVYILKNRKNTDIFIASQTGSSAGIALTLKKFIKCKVFVRIAGSELLRFDDENLKFKKRFKNVDKFIILNDEMKNTLDKLEEKRVTKISNAVICNNNTQKSGGDYVLFCGRIEKVKGVDLLLETWVKLEKNGFDIPLIIVGDGSQKSILENKYRYLKRVNWVGMQSDTSKYYNNAKILINSSSYEGISNTILEAMSFGIPIIATNVGGNSELVKSMYNGLLIQRDIESLYNAIVNLYNDNDTLEKMGNNSKIIIKQNHEIQKIVNKYESLFFE